MPELKQSDIVLSLAGHDSGKLYMVSAVEDDFVLLADGKVRRLSDPKRKKIKHAQFQSDSPLADKFRRGAVTDKDIRRILAIYKSVKSLAK